MATTALTGTINDTIVLKTFQRDAYGGTSNTAVTWASSAPAVAVVQNIYNSNNGVVTCLSAGTATITATMGAVTATFTLTVNAVSTNAGATLVVEADNSFQPVNKTTQTQTS